MLERAGNLTASDERETLYTLEIRVLNRHDALLREEGFRVVVDELPVDEDVDAMGSNRVNLCLHLFL